MTNFASNLPHLIMATVLIAASSALAATGTISGSDAIVIISAAGGVSIGAAGVATGVAVGSSQNTPEAAPTPKPTTTATPTAPAPPVA